MKYSLLLLFSFLFQVLSGQNNGELKKEIQELVASQKSFEGVVLIAEKGRPIYQEAFGFRDLEQQKANLLNTHFPIASITKMITSIIIMQLEEEGKLDLKAPISKYLEKVDIPNKEMLTSHYLLLHISGLPNEANQIFDQYKLADKFISETIKNGSVKEPGTFNYANIDYVILGKIIERIEGKSWEEVVEERIIHKLNLSQTGFTLLGDYPDNFAYGFHINENGQRSRFPNIHIENYGAAGSMYSTAEDLLKIDQAMYQENFLSQLSRDKMFTSYPEYNYSGYGVWSYRYPFLDNQPLLMERRGGILGWNSVIVRFLESNKTIIILSNNDQFNPDSFGDMKSLKEALIILIEKNY